ncbi:MAG TPA: hypothetical protein VJ397_01090 [Thermoplasmata archaeon]|nr:hypothetical protein [Thermoplasmata archaeon]
MPTLANFSVSLVVLAEESDLDASMVEEVLDVARTRHLVRSISYDSEHGVLLIEFGREPQEPSGRSAVSDKEPEDLHTAAAWLRERSPVRFRSLFERGLKADVVIQGYAGWVPIDLLQEILRLGIRLSIAPINIGIDEGVSGGTISR